MKKLILFFALATSANAAFTEFYALSGVGANTNSGIDQNAGCIYSSKSGNYNASTHLFNPTDSSNPVTAGITNGAFVCIYTNGNTNATYEAKVTGVVNDINGGITLSTIAFSGTEPATSSGNITLTFGGAWNGPTLVGDSFPFNWVSGAMTNDAGNSPRVNFKGTWFVTNTITDTLNNGVVWFQGYTNAPGDLISNFSGVGLRPNFYGSNNIAGYTLMIVSGKNRNIADFNFATNGNSGSSTQHLLSFSGGAECQVIRCSGHDSRLAAFAFINSAFDCEGWNCDLANSASYGAFYSGSAGSALYNCFAHDNTAGVNAVGFETDGIQTVYNCISANNTGDGFRGTGDVGIAYVKCEAFNNGGAGIHMIGASGATSDPMSIHIMNCSFVKNGKCAITNDTGAVSGYYNGSIINCAFGTGTMTNTGGDIEGKLQGVQVSGSVAYTANSFPYTATNNYTFNGSLNKGAGFGTWLNVSGLNYATTMAYPDIGASQHQDTGSGGTTSKHKIFGL